MLLELDIVNMGVQTRRAVRELKMRMTEAAADLDLKPTIDSFQDLLGGHGFTGLNRCVVGVPVTGQARRFSGLVDIIAVKQRLRRSALACIEQSGHQNWTTNEKPQLLPQ